MRLGLGEGGAPTVGRMASYGQITRGTSFIDDREPSCQDPSNILLVEGTSLSS